MAASDKIKWTKNTEVLFSQLKQQLVSSSVLALPNSEKPFVQTVDCKNGFMTSVLLQEHGGRQRPIAYYSTKLDPVALAMPPCLQAVIAAAMTVISSTSIVLYHELTLLVPHTVSVILLQHKLSHVTCTTPLMHDCTFITTTFTHTAVHNFKPSHPVTSS